MGLSEPHLIGSRKGRPPRPPGRTERQSVDSFSISLDFNALQPGKFPRNSKPLRPLSVGAHREPARPYTTSCGFEAAETLPCPGADSMFQIVATPFPGRLRFARRSSRARDPGDRKPRFKRSTSPLVSRSRTRSLRSAVARRGAPRRARSGAGGSGGGTSWRARPWAGSGKGRKRNRSMNCLLQKDNVALLKNSAPPKAYEALWPRARVRRGARCRDLRKSFAFRHAGSDSRARIRQGRRRRPEAKGDAPSRCRTWDHRAR